VAGEDSRMSTTNNVWESFFGNPLIPDLLEEAGINPEPTQDAQTQQQPEDHKNELLAKLAQDISDGHLTKEDLIDMYKSGKLNQEEIQNVLMMSEGEEPPTSQPQGQPQDAEPQTEEELMAQQIDQTNDMFIKFALYDKTNDLTEKLNYFKNNFTDNQTSMYKEIIQLKEFLDILSNLIFNMETAVSYQMYGSLLLKLTELFDKYNKYEFNKESKIHKSNKEDEDSPKYQSDLDKWAEENIYQKDN